MPKTLPTGALIPEVTDRDDVPAALAAYDRTVLRPLVVTSLTAAETLRGKLNADGWTGPVMAYCQDIRCTYIHPNAGITGETWDYHSGPQAGMVAALTGETTGSGAAFPVSSLSVSTVHRQSTGWTVTTTTSGTEITAPATGLYAITTRAELSGFGGAEYPDITRAVVIGKRGGTEVMRHATAQNQTWSGTTMMNIIAGETMTFDVQCIHGLSSRTVSWSVSAIIAQLGRPGY